MRGADTNGTHGLTGTGDGLMKDDRYSEEERRAREEAYREYLRLRQEAPKVSITETPYGASALRKKQREDRDARAAYEAARESAREEAGGRRFPGRSPRRREDARAWRESERLRREADRSWMDAERMRSGIDCPRRLDDQEPLVRRDGQKPRREPAPARREGRRPPHRKRPDVQALRPIAENSSDETIRKREKRRGRGSGRGPKKRSGLRKAVIIAAIVLAVLLGLCGCVFTMAAGALSSVGSLDIDKHNLGISDQAKNTLKDYENIAVLGVDSRNMDDDSESRSDAMVIVSINRKTDEVKMFSVFRDTMLDLGEDHGLDKITHAYAYGGAELSLYALNHNIDLNIKKAVVINWKTVAEIIDTIGGIEIDVQESEIDEINKYVSGTARRTGSEKIKVEHAGKQTLNGAQAVTYARIRKDAVTGDYRRNERMKIVMATTFKKLKESDLMTIKQVCDNALPQTKTNLSTTEMMKLGLTFKRYNMTSSTTGWPYDVQGWIGTAGGGAAWYGPPVTLESNVKKLYKKFFGISGYEPTMEVKSISEEISALTGLY